MAMYWRVLRYLSPYKIQIFFSIVLTLLFTGANVLFLPLTRDLINEITNRNLIHFGNQIFNAVFLWFIRISSQFGQFYVTSWISNRIIIDMQVEVYKKCHSFSQHFYAKWKLGDILTRLFSDSDITRKAIMLSFWEVIPQTCTFIGVLGYLLYLNWQLTLFALVAVPMFIGIIMYFTNLLKRVSQQVQQKTADITHISQESLSNVKLVQAYTMESKEIDRFLRENLRNFKANMTAIRFQATLEPIVAFFHFAVIAAVVYFGGHQMAKGSLTGPALASFFTGIFLLIDPIQALSKVYTTLQQAMVSAKRIFEIIDLPVQLKEIDDPIVKTVQGHVDIKNVSFRYEGATDDVLRDISINAEKGSIVALVGLSGAGKTTLINLIPRFYDPTQGQILIDGIPLTDYSIQSIRQQIALVMQDDILFRGTIMENIRYGSPNATMEEVIVAAKQAQAMEFIDRFPDGLHTKVGDRGRRLSGGQKQRISIARALLRDPKILILDEATSALDSQSEHLVQKALHQLMQNRTTFVIAHRLSTIMHANQIVVMNKGAIVERGSHEQLLAQKGHYSELYQLQFNKTLDSVTDQ